MHYQYVGTLIHPTKCFFFSKLGYYCINSFVLPFPFNILSWAFYHAFKYSLKMSLISYFSYFWNSDPVFPFINKSLVKIICINMYIHYFLKFLEELFDHSVNILRYFDTYSQNNFQKCYHLLNQLTSIYWAYTICLILYRSLDYNEEYCS